MSKLHNENGSSRFAIGRGDSGAHIVHPFYGVLPQLDNPNISRISLLLIAKIQRHRREDLGKLKTATLCYKWGITHPVADPIVPDLTSATNVFLLNILYNFVSSLPTAITHWLDDYLGVVVKRH